jgi:hypothetical protein
MKQSHLSRYLVAMVLGLVVLTGWSTPGLAQSSEDIYSAQELAQMLAPVALYPDALLSQILVAATYPIEVIEAGRWLRRHPSLDDDDLDDALYDQEWDPSVKALCHFPTLLSRMSEHISETTNLGNAFLAQEQDVMEMVQRLRDRAYREGNLTGTRQQDVIIEKEVIIIQPARSRVIYVPYYDPYYVYGHWWYPDYPPYYWGPANVNLGFGVTFSSGISLSFILSSWSYFDWSHHVIYFNPHKRPRFVRKAAVMSPRVWQHESSHRRGVAYRDKHTAQKYGQFPHSSETARRESRGYRTDSDRRSVERYESRTRSESTSAQQETQRNITRQRSESKRSEPSGRHEAIGPQQPDRRSAVQNEPEQNKKRYSQNERKTIQMPTTQVRKPAEQRRVDAPTQRTRKTDETRQGLENVFSRVDDGRSERQSSQRGKASRQRQIKEPMQQRK